MVKRHSVHGMDGATHELIAYYYIILDTDNYIVKEKIEILQDGQEDLSKNILNNMLFDYNTLMVQYKKNMGYEYLHDPGRQNQIQ